MDKKVYVYHFTNESKERPIVYQKQVEELKEYASWFGDVEQISVDKTLKESEQTEKIEMLKKAEFDVLVTKDFYHINKHTNRCFEILKELFERGVKITTLEDGEVVFCDADFDKSVRVCIYHSRCNDKEDISISTQLSIFHLFVSTKTNWSVIDIFVDEDDSQTKLRQMIESRNDYDLVVVKQVSCVNERTSKFFKIMKELKLPIFSLREGEIHYVR